MPVEVPWSRLIRFVSAEDDDIHFGDAVVPSADFDVGDPKNAQSLTAKLIEGNPLSPDCKVTDKVVKVKKLLGPLTRDMVPALRCIGGNYRSHLKEMKMEIPRNPLLFAKFPNAVAGYGDDIPIPKLIQDGQADYEAELAIVIGKEGKDIRVEDAMDYVLGYTAADDMSARKWQSDPDLVGTWPPPQMTFAKSFDGFCPMGPCIASTKVIPNPHALPLKTYVNGELRQNGNTDDFVFNVPQLIAFLSQGNTLQAGSIILTGTCSGVGFAMKPPQHLKTGDRIEISFGPIGTLVHGIKYE
ncbi:hypothetical protein AYL99_10713 [Fonsecaea erecta]|uniref:Fumarylacetoacetase-like C-terminal domain-containing protein n=1 Tax=Fonsecaea erecta TaxID=1367422 RepID=A0A178Z753_9EURO|nr:hypothetical protein AYL99_10713 [Fonsecaea erecta]OAP55013.1 hypothetical protein AYL99_10713 [Fonsecaea erecta]